MSDTLPRLRVSRRFAAPAERVFDAWLDPAGAGRWLYATATGSNVRTEIDACVGGRFRITDRRDGVDWDHVGEYLAIDRPRRLAFTLTIPNAFPEASRVAVEITPREEGCELVIRHDGISGEIAARAERAWERILGALDAVLSERRAVTAERRLPYPRERVWRMLTTSASLAKWLMPNDFAPVHGHRFTFRAEQACATDWDGIVRCEVLEIDPPRRLRYSWESGVAGGTGMAAPLASMVTWTLEPIDGGTVLRLEHDGFGPGTETVRAAVNDGWPVRIGMLADAMAETTPDQDARQS
jgi:uncharacterized protein YndB with AHSA1/START domain